MKKGIHPETYRLVAFKDMSNEDVFITRSCVNTKETIEIEGVEYPLVKVEISNTSHPFYTGKVKIVDTAGRVDQFYQRYKSRKKYTRAGRNNHFFLQDRQIKSRRGRDFIFLLSIFVNRETRKYN